MFLETAVAVFLLGWLVAFAFLYLVNIRPLERQLNDMHRKQLREMRQRAYRAELRRAHLASLKTVHKGTPYISPPGSELERILVDIAGVVDDHNGSRKAPELRVVS